MVLLGSGDGASVWWTWRGGGLLVIPPEEPPGAESQGDDQHPDERNEQAGVVSPRRLRGLCRSRWSRGTVVARIRDAVHGRVAGCCSFLPPGFTVRAAGINASGVFPRGPGRVQLLPGRKEGFGNCRHL